MRAGCGAAAAAIALCTCTTEPTETGSALPAAGESPPSRQAVALSNRGALFLQQNSPRRALTALRKAIDLAPELPDAHFNLGLVLARLGRHAEAVAAYESAGRLGFESAGLHLAHGASLRALNRYAPAADAFSRALPMAAGRADLHLARGEVLRAMGHLDSALAAFERASALDSTLGEAERYRGELLAASGRLEEAASAYGRAIALEPADSGGLLGRAEVLRRSGDLDAALRDLEAAVDLDPRSQRARYLLAIAADELGLAGAAAEARGAFQRLTAAQRHFDQARVYAGRARRQAADLEFLRSLEIDSTFAEAWVELGVLRLADGRPADALEPLRRASALLPGDGRPRELLGETHLRLGAPQAALASFTAAESLGPSSAALSGRARALLALERYDDASRAFRRLQDHDPDALPACFHLGLIYARQGRAREAAASLRKCLDVDPEHVESHFALGSLLAESGDAAGAREHLSRVLSLDPDHPRAEEKLAALPAP